jgi:hypothetical protein
MLLGGAPLTRAQTPWNPNPPPRVIEDRLRLDMDLFAADISTTLRVDPAPQRLGTVVSAEKDLGLRDSKLLPHVELTLLPGERSLIRLSSFSAKREGSAVLSRNIVFDDNTYRVNERVNSVLDLTMVGLTYGYRLLRAEPYELAATFGVQVASVNANVYVPARVIREENSGVAPLPLLGLEGRLDATRRWSFDGRVQYLTANISDTKGTVMDWRLGTNWRFNPYLSAGLEYRSFKIDVDSRSNSDPGRVDMNFKGPQLRFRASF